MCWDCYDHPKGDPYKIFTQGGVPVEDFDDEVRYRHAPRKNKAKKPKAKGCPANDFKAHVYVWVTETHYYSRYNGYGFYEDKTRPYTVDCKTCCGCGKIATRRYHW
jgi:hypothetical protein